MRPELMTSRTESVLVPYKFFSNSPNSMNFPLAKSFSKAVRLTKWYSYPFRSCILAVLVVSAPETKHTVSHLGRGTMKMHRNLKIPDITVHALCMCTYVEQQWQIFLVERTAASDAAHRVRCLWGQSERWAVSDWWAGDRATSPHMSGHRHSLKRQNRRIFCSSKW